MKSPSTDEATETLLIEAAENTEVLSEGEKDSPLRESTDSTSVAADKDAAEPEIRTEQAQSDHNEPGEQKSASGNQEEGGVKSVNTEPSALFFNPVARVRSAFRSQLSGNKTSIFAITMLSMAACYFYFSPAAFITLMCWLVALLVLTRLTVSDAPFLIESSDQGISISRNSKFGKDTLNLQWKQIESLEQVTDEESGNDEFVIRIKKGSLNPFWYYVFRDVFNSKNTIRIRPEAPVARNTESKDSRALEAATTDEFCRQIALRCPPGMFTSRRLLPKQAPDLEQQLMKGAEGFAVSYLPISQSQKHCSRLLKTSEKWLLPSMAMCGLAVLLAFGAHVAITMIVALTIPLFMLIMATREASHSLIFTDAGITIVWTAHGSTQRSRPIPWDAVDYVAHNVQFEKKGKRRDKIEFRLNAATAAKHVKILQDNYLSIGLFRQEDKRSVLSIDTGGLDGTHSRQKLLAAINRYMSADRIDASVGEALNPTDLTSYTQLWMSSLGNESSRRFDGRLATGRGLRNGMFEIVDFLGAGGQANVYIAKLNQCRLPAVTPFGEGNENDAKPEKIDELPISNETVVLKEFILPSHAGAELSLRSLANIRKEFDLMKKLRHDNIVRYIDIFVEDHRCYLILEHVKGKCLRTRVEECGPFSQEQIVPLALQMAELLHHLHTHTPAVIHRDFTPENLILDEHGTLKLIDFNVAQELEECATRTIVGKHGYLPPEQFRGKACPQSDIYAMGATLYFLLTGEEPEPITCSHPIIRNEAISPELDAVVAHATELELEKRFAGASDLLNELKALADSRKESADSEPANSADQRIEQPQEISSPSENGATP